MKQWSFSELVSGCDDQVVVTDRCSREWIAPQARLASCGFFVRSVTNHPFGRLCFLCGPSFAFNDPTFCGLADLTPYIRPRVRFPFVWHLMLRLIRLEAL